MSWYGTISSSCRLYVTVSGPWRCSWRWASCKAVTRVGARWKLGGGLCSVCDRCTVSIFGIVGFALFMARRL
jgi:hypothetical protein